MIEKLKKAGILNDPAIESIKDDHGEEHNVTLIYNFTRGTMDDLLETFFQIRESGQLDGVWFFSFVGALLSGNPIIAVGVLVAAVAPMQDTQKFEQETVDKMIDAYNKYSVDKGNQIMLVSHSQGNLFANRVFDELNATGYDYKNFANVQVASPADQVRAPIGKHITVCGDMVVGPIPRSMRCNAEANAPGLRHGFDDVYLKYEDPRSQIMNAVKGQISVLKDPSKAKEARDNGAIDSDHDQAGIIPTAKSLPYLGLLAAVMIFGMTWALRREEQEA